MTTPARRVFAACACVVLIAQPALASLALHTIPSSSVGTVLADDDAIERIMSMVDSPTTSTTGGQLASLSSSGSLFLADTLAGAAGIAGIAYYSRTGKDPVYAAFDAVASAADALFVPAYQAFKAKFVSPESYPASAAQYVGVEGSVGAKLGDIVDFVSNSADGLYSDLKSLFASNVLPSIGYPSGSLSSGTVICDSSGALWKVISITSGNLNASSYSSYVTSSRPTIIYDGHTGWFDSLSFYVFYPELGVISYKYYQGVRIIVEPTTLPTTLDPTSGGYNYSGIKTQLQDNLDAALADEIRNAVKAMPADQKILSSDPAPSAVPAQTASPITNNDISNFFTSNTTNIYNQYLTDIQSEDTTITNEVAKAAAETAKAQEEEAEKEEEEEETFNPITDSAFEEPYNPGEFDIPARFTQFLNNVKSSGLFSFSNDFFNSLPGGGSPVYEIEAGQYGHHTIDLSSTLSTGLAVLKTILLVCFGFLSIRAVIMKR